MVYLIIPCYNEEEVLPDTNRKLLGLLPELPDTVHICYVDDGSSDSTWALIRQFSVISPVVRGIRLSHNVGQQQATWAGLEQCVSEGDAFITLDADLQDDIKVLSSMIKDWQNGTDVVYGVREDRPSDSFVKRWSARLFYSFMEHLDCGMVSNHSEFRLLSHRAAMSLLSYSERNLFVRGIIPQLGFNVCTEVFERQPRTAGQTKYSLRSLFSLAFDGITSFSVRPLHWILLSGMFFIFISIGVILWALYNHFIGRTVMGWTSLLVSVWFVGGCLLLSLGLLGEYLGKVYKEVKRRPRYFIMEQFHEVLD